MTMAKKEQVSLPFFTLLKLYTQEEGGAFPEMAKGELFSYISKNKCRFFFQKLLCCSKQTNYKVSRLSIKGVVKVIRLISSFC